jgi:hypothetical protein
MSSLEEKVENLLAFHQPSLLSVSVLSNVFCGHSFVIHSCNSFFLHPLLLCS